MNILYRHPASIEPALLLRDCEVKRTRRSGPGGQNRNKVETAVIIRHMPSGIEAEANERRSQAENLKTATLRLRVNLALSLRSARERGASPTLLWQARTRGGRITISREHSDFPAILAEALDVLDAQGTDVKAAAEALQCSPSQLIRLLKAEPRALAHVNARRAQIGLRPLL
jgi:RF-1 domain